MTRGFFAAATGMLAEDSAQHAVSHNISNGGTTDFRQGLPVVESIDETHVSIVADCAQHGALGHDASFDTIATDIPAGSRQPIATALDAALRRNAYPAIKPPAGVTRPRHSVIAIYAQAGGVPMGGPVRGSPDV